MAEKKKTTKTARKTEVIQPAVLETTFDEPALKYGRLRRWNMVAAGIFIVQAAAILLLAKGRSLPVTISYQAQDPLQTAAQGSNVLVPASHHLFDINILYLVAAWLIVAGIAHGLIATRLRHRYEANLQQGSTPARWLMQAIASSLVAATAGLLFGIENAAVLLAVTGLMLVVHLGGLLIEKPGLPLQPLRKLSLIIGAITGLVPFGIYTLYLVGAALYGAAPAGYLWWLYGIVGAMLAAGGVNMVLQHARLKRWNDFLFGEYVYSAIAVAGLSAAAWLIFAGALRP